MRRRIPASRVTRAAGLFLSLAVDVVERHSDTRVWLFVDRPVDATREIQRWLSTTRAADRDHRSFQGLLDQIPDLNPQAASPGR